MEGNLDAVEPILFNHGVAPRPKKKPGFPRRASPGNYTCQKTSPPNTVRPAPCKCAPFREPFHFSIGVINQKIQHMGFHRGIHDGDINFIVKRYPTRGVTRKPAP